MGAGRDHHAVAEEGDLVDRVEHQRAGARRRPWSGRRGGRAAGRRSGPRCARRRPRSARPGPGSRGRRPGPGPAPAAAAGRRRRCGRARPPPSPGPSGRASKMSSVEAVSSARSTSPAWLGSPPLVSRTVPSRPENRTAPVSETTTRRRTSSRESASSGTPPRVTSASTSAAQRPSRSASAAASSGWSLTRAVISPARTRSPVRASASSAPAAGPWPGRRGRGGRA